MACEIDFNPVTLSWRSTVDNLGENLAGPDRSAALRVKRVREGEWAEKYSSHKL